VEFKGPDSDKVAVPYHVGFMFPDNVVYRVDIRTVNPLKGPQPVNMVRVIVSYQHAAQIIIVVFDELQHLFVHLAGIDDHRFPDSVFFGNLGPQDIAIAETEAAVMTEKFHPSPQFQKLLPRCWKL
jgi:hypothetical protein